ncbi:hypothetical protein [Eubacterium sp. 1001713B170207_170306_E7]|uniref:hypothetical protein n=1 Tax=Eubacterium sp. 1001713B170207_170306_E7 TaxID=2787097 RepID=UPI00189A124D|nr:hypothetical protein [Eubacterium sp. 1001713B170207_170306_E7]
MKKYMRNGMILCALSPLIAYYLHFMVGTASNLIFMTLSSVTGNSAVAYLGYLGGMEMVPAWTLAINVTVLIYLFYRWDLEKKKSEEP